MLPGVERCDECGFTYDEAAAPEAARMIRDGAAGLAAILEAGHAGLRTRRQPGRWSPLEYACHVRDMLYVQRERLLAARRLNQPECTPMGRDERVELDGYAKQDPADVARQLSDAAGLFANDLGRLSGTDWGRRVIYTYPERAERSLRWLAIHTVHEVRHHLHDVRQQVTGTVSVDHGPWTEGARPMGGYLDYSGRDDVLSGGSRWIPVNTPAGTYRVWVKRTGNNPALRVLLLHGGPGSTHEYLEACDSYLPAAGVEYYYYDQLGSGFSDQPAEPSLWELDRFVDEVEQVRGALGLNRENFVLYGQSWGGILAIEYALRHQEHLRALVISNMMSSVPAYNTYAEQVLMPEMDQSALAEIKSLEAAGDIENPRYMQLLYEQHYVHHVLRMPPDEWPDSVQRGFAHINPAIYVSMQGPSELGISPGAKLACWDRTDQLSSIEVPALVIGARYDTMDPAYLAMMADRLPAGRYLYCPNGSHLAMYDDQQVYFGGLIGFLHDLAGG